MSETPFWDEDCLHSNAAGSFLVRCPDCGRTKLRHETWGNFKYPRSSALEAALAAKDQENAELRAELRERIDWWQRRYEASVGETQTAGARAEALAAALEDGAELLKTVRFAVIRDVQVCEAMPAWDAAVDQFLDAVFDAAPEGKSS